MPDYSFYDFACHEQRSPAVEVRIPEHALQDTEFHNYTWPCAVELSRYIIGQRQTFRGKRFLEIGSGTALPSAVVASLGFSIVATDQSSAVHVCRRTLMECNKFIAGNCVEIASFDWVDENSFNDLVTNPVCRDGFDVVLCSDCYYDDAVIADVTVTLSMLLRKWPKALVLCAYQVRDFEWLLDIDAGLNAFNLRRTPIVADKTIKCFVGKTVSTDAPNPSRKRKHLCGAEIMLWQIEREILP